MILNLHFATCISKVKTNIDQVLEILIIVLQIYRFYKAECYIVIRFYKAEANNNRRRDERNLLSGWAKPCAC